MTALRERLLVALPTSETGHDGGCVSPFSRCEVDWGSKADRLIAALGPDAARLDAALAPDAVVVDRDLLAALVETTACRFDHHGGCQEHGFLEPEDPWSPCPMAEAQRLLGLPDQEPTYDRRLLGIDGGQ